MWRLGDAFGASWGLWGAPWELLGALGCSLETLWELWDAPGELLGAPWELLGGSGVLLGEVLGALWGLFRASGGGDKIAEELRKQKNRNCQKNQKVARRSVGDREKLEKQGDAKKSIFGKKRS